ncbi:MAG: DNA polymerase Y family protein [Micrococcales bacterium]|nr:DNA polymerase Y family protein [Micrococcales bacterium]
MNSAPPGRRLAALWVPDWPVVAAIMAGQAPADQPVIVLGSGRVKALSAAARKAGARRGMKRRTAQDACPAAQLVPADQARDARTFAQLAKALDDQVPGVELLRPGLALCPAGRAARYHGSDQALAEHLLDELTTQTGSEAWVGVADGPLAAILAARENRIVQTGHSSQFLEPRPLPELQLALQGTVQADVLNPLIDLLARLGVRTLGDLANLPASAVSERFGTTGIWARRLARAEDALIVTALRPEPQFVVQAQPDPPVTQIEAAAFLGRRLAEDLHRQLAHHGQSYDRLRIEATTEHGETLSRSWRLDGVDATGVRDRLRWQLEGWLTGRSGLAPTGALVLIRLQAEEVHPAGGSAARLWDNEGQAQARAARGADRLQAMLGEGAVFQPVEQGGRDPRSRIRLVQWGDEAVPLRPLNQPWPGKLPDPAPALVPSKPWPVNLSDAGGNLVRVSATLELSGEPSRLDNAPVKGWAGPWPVVERWWTRQPQRRVYLQVESDQPVSHAAEAQLLPAKTRPNSAALDTTVPEGTPVSHAAEAQLLPAKTRPNGTVLSLLACQNGVWQIEGVYD